MMTNSPSHFPRNSQLALLPSTSRLQVKCHDLYDKTGGDGHRPVCFHCQRGPRDCQWASVVQDTNSSQSHYQNYVSAKNPEIALQDARAARIFRYYIDHLAGWYDLNDSRCHFQHTVPVHARQNPLLLSAILAFSAASQGSRFANPQLRELADTYHLESVQILLSLTNTVDEFRTGQTLAAICLLRSYEIITQNASAQNHLRGSYSLLASRPYDLGSGLMRAGFWNYLREDITVALMEKRNLMIELNDRHPPLERNGDDDFANHVTYILGRIINYCLRHDETSRSEWQPLKEELENWKASLPSSFEPISTPGLAGKGTFPSLWTISKWHTSGLQYYHISMIILYLTEPISRPSTTLRHIDRIKSLETKLEYHAIQICALAVSSDSAPIWVNSFGPISFCGPWLKQPRMRAGLSHELECWGDRTGWPVSDIVKSLANDSA